jgi:hypothetical protein
MRYPRPPRRPRDPFDLVAEVVVYALICFVALMLTVLIGIALGWWS